MQLPTPLTRPSATLSPRVRGERAGGGVLRHAEVVLKCETCVDTNALRARSEGSSAVRPGGCGRVRDATASDSDRTSNQLESSKFRTALQCRRGFEDSVPGRRPPGS
jgi:hypothetical protein